MSTIWGPKRTVRIAENKEADEAARCDCEQEIAKLHAEDAGREDEEFEWRRRRQDRGDHQREELALLKRRAQVVNLGLRDALGERNFAALASDVVDEDRAEC
jgi:hypothetical protein